jgi:hypothetical protein
VVHVELAVGASPFKRRKTQTVVEWCGHAQEYIPQPEVDRVVADGAGPGGGDLASISVLMRSASTQGHYR